MTTGDAYGASAGQQPPNSPPTKAALASWWERFKKRNGRESEKEAVPGIFGVPLQQSINYANVAISLTNAEGKSQVYGYVPVVVAKCGVFLKEKATDVEGIFRLSGSAKRIKDLQLIFDSPEKYGKGLDWTGYTVHDAANVLRRYLNQLPEPIIPLDFYTRFRDPLTINPNDFDVPNAIGIYQDLIKEIPPLNRQLLLYILDLLAVFASKADQNLMTAANLAAIFQPGLISHPSHEMAPQAYKLSQDVLVFLINQQDHFLLGMRGNNEGTGGPELPKTPKTGSFRYSDATIGRSNSNGSAGAEDVRKFGGIRRNVSVSSKKSASPAQRSTGGVSRSNTLPSRRSPRVPAPAFRPVDGSSSPRSATNRFSYSEEPHAETINKPTPIDIPKRALGFKTPEMGTPAGSRHVSGGFTQLDKPSQHSPVTTPTRERNFANIFSLSPGESDRPQRKLRKKRIPGSNNHSAESSTTSLAIGGGPSTVETQTSTLSAVPQSPPPQYIRALSPTPVNNPGQNHNGQSNGPANSTSNLMLAMSPTPSATSSVTSQDSIDKSVSDVTTNTSTSPEKKKRSRWRWSNSKVDRWDPPTSPTFGASNGSIAERIRRASRSPPANGHRKASSETSDGDESISSRKPFGWLPRRKPENTQRPEEKKDLVLPPEAFSVPPQHQLPTCLQIQPPTPVSQRGPMGPLIESPRSQKDSPRSVDVQPQIPEVKETVPAPEEIQVQPVAQTAYIVQPGHTVQLVHNESNAPDSPMGTPKQSQAATLENTNTRVRPVRSMLYIDEEPVETPRQQNFNYNPQVLTPVQSPVQSPVEKPVSSMLVFGPPLPNGTVQPVEEEVSRELDENSTCYVGIAR